MIKQHDVVLYVLVFLLICIIIYVIHNIYKLLQEQKIRQREFELDMLEKGDIIQIRYFDDNETAIFEDRIPEKGQIIITFESFGITYDNIVINEDMFVKKM